MKQDLNVKPKKPPITQRDSAIIRLACSTSYSIDSASRDEGSDRHHEQVAQALHDVGRAMSLVNPAQIKTLGKTLAVRTKTDGVDRLLSARLGLLCKPDVWLPPPPATLALKALLARQQARAEALQRERNRQEKFGKLSGNNVNKQSRILLIGLPR